jgi:hypothetical protein
MLRGEAVRVRVRALAAMIVRAAMPLPSAVAGDGQFRIGGRPQIVEARHRDRSLIVGGRL